MTIFKINAIVFRIILAVSFLSLAIEPILLYAYGRKTNTGPEFYLAAAYLLIAFMAMTLYARSKNRRLLKVLRYVNMALSLIWVIVFGWTVAGSIANGEYRVLAAGLLCIFLGVTSLWGLIRDMKKTES